MSGELTDTAEVVLKRFTVLRRIVDAPTCKRDLTEEMEVPRSTLDNIIRELEDNHLVEYADGAWTATLLGECLTSLHEEYILSVESLQKSCKIFSHICPPPSIPKRILRDFEAIIDDEGFVLDSLAEDLSPEEQLKISSPALRSSSIHSLTKILDENPDVNINYCVPHEERLMNVGEMNSNINGCENRLAITRSDNVPEFGVWISDGRRIAVVVHTEWGVRGAIVTSKPYAVTWAENIIKSDT